MTIRIILFLGICYVGFMLSFVKHEIPFSEDSGIKTLMIKQYQKGEFQSTLSLAAPVWIEKLWNQGLYPFRKPFVYDLPKGKTVVFPPLFQIISTPFYSTFGFRGLFIIPVISTFLLWLLFVNLCKTLKLKESVINVALIAVVFSSSLTLYSAIFWEHTLASLLCLCGLFYLIQVNSKKENQNRAIGLLYGVATGLSVWLRPEALIILTTLLAWSFYWIVNANMKHIHFFVLGTVFSVIGFFIFNYFVFENPLGLRSKQIVDRFDLVQRLKDGGYIFIVLCVKTILFDPISLIVIFCLAINSKSVYQELKVTKAVSVTNLILISVCFFYLVAPWLLPNTGGNNWGIRYALVCTPFVYVLAAVLSNEILLKAQRLTLLMAVAFILLTAGVIKNTIMGTQMLFGNYNGPKSRVLDYLSKEKPPVILITKSYHAGEFESAMPQSSFILVDTKESLQKFTNTPESKTTTSILIYDSNDTYSDLPLKESELNNFVLQESFRNFKVYKYSLE